MSYWRMRGPLLVALLVCGMSFLPGLATECAAQAPLGWQDVRARFEATNPTLQAGRLAIDESRATEITAFLRPNPQLSIAADQFAIVGQASDPFQNVSTVASLSYLHERRQKRELRRASAQGATLGAVLTQADLERTLIFSLRSQFILTLQAKALRALARESLANYDEILRLSRGRLDDGDIAQIDFDRLHLQRVQYEADVQTADVNLRTAKIQLLRLLNEPIPVDQFDVAGPYDFVDPPQTLEALRQTAIGTRPDLKAALQAIDKAVVDHRLAVANGSADPVVAMDVGHAQPPASLSFNPPMSTWLGVNMSVPLRLFDRNQGEKRRTDIDITRNRQLAEATRSQVLSDVDSAYASLTSTLALLKPYKATYLEGATRVRDTLTFSYQRGGASLIEFLQAQQEYRSVQVGYLNLVAAFLNAVNQLNLAVGQEVIP
jgi:outer membrane protein, heavy metal efflux system